MNISSCPKCGTKFQTPLAPSDACPNCGVFFFKLTSASAGDEPRSRHRDDARPGGRPSGVMLVLVIAIVAGIGFGIRSPGRSHEAPQSGSVPPTTAPVAATSASPQTTSVAVPAQPAQQAIADMAGNPPEGTKSSEIDRILEKLPPFVRKLVTSPDIMFDMQEETYRIANANKIHLEDVFFDGNEVRANVGDGSSFAAAAFAMTGLRGERRVCAIRVIRPSSDSSYSPGAKTSRWVTVNRRTTLAHELAHCVDWQSGGPDRPANLPRPPDNISSADQDRRWREEFADVHAMTLLKNAYGEESAREAATVRAFIRLDAPIWYSHARVPLSSPELLQSGSPEGTRAIVGRYWGS